MPLQWQLNQRSEEIHLSRSLVSYSSRASREMEGTPPAVDDSVKREDAVLLGDEGAGSSRPVERSPSNRIRCVPIERLRSPVDEEPAVIWDTSEDESSSAPYEDSDEDDIWFYTPYSHKWYADPVENGMTDRN